MNRQRSVQNLHLQPFSAENTPEDCRINVLLSRDETSLQVVFELDAKLTDLIIPDYDFTKLQRRDNLWEHTCFEVFLAQKGMPNYWEFNLSPSGDWNVYSFKGYREGMRQETYFNILPFEVKILSGRIFKLEITIDLKFFQDFSDIDLGLSSVLEWSDGVKSYWAVRQHGDIPDFHVRTDWLESF